jgi:hypothetical protein
VRIEAAGTLVELDRDAAALAVLEKTLSHEQPEVVLHAARTLELLGEKARPVLPAMRTTLERAQQGEKAGGDIWMFVRFSLASATASLDVARQAR